MKQTLNEKLYRRLWKNKKQKMFRKSIFIAIPFALLFVFYTIIQKRNAWYVDNGYGFLNDTTNVVVVSYLFLIVYYVSGWYNTYSNKILEKYCQKIQDFNEMQSCTLAVEKVDKRKGFLHFIAIIFCLCGLWFIRVADKNGIKNWYSLLTAGELRYYKFLIIAAWYMSVNVIFQTMITAVKIYKISQYSIKLDMLHHDKCGGMAGVFSLFFWNLGVTVFFLLSAIIIIVSDFRATSFNVENAFVKYPGLFFGIALVLIVYLSFTFVPFIECKRIITDQTEKALESNDYNSEEIERIKLMKSSMFNVRNVMNFIAVNFFHIVYITLDLIKIFYNK